MDWIDIACIIVACTSANHLGLVAAVEGILHHRLPIVNCAKCSTFWTTLIYCSVCCDIVAALTHSIPTILAVSFLAAYAAVWLELLMACTDILYNYIYEKIINQETDTEGQGSGRR